MGKAPELQLVQPTEIQVEDLGTAQLVMQEVAQNPGIFKSEVCRRLALGWGTVSHHVRRLQDSGQLNVELVAGRACLFLPHIAHSQRLRLVTLMRSEQFLVHLERGPTTVPELCRVSGLSRRVVQRKLDELLRAGVVERAGHYRPTYSMARARPGP